MTSIYIVQPGDTIESIATTYHIPKNRLITDNGLTNPDKLVIGQTIVIAWPEVTYTIKKGDTLLSIANAYNVTVMQLIINNPYFSRRKYLYPGDEVVIKYSTKGSITTYGTTLPYISDKNLKKTLPYLTYISVLNYTITKAGGIISYYDDTEIIKTATKFKVIPLMLITTLTLSGETNVEVAYDLLLNTKFQQNLIENILKILEEKGYAGINISFEHINESNIELYEEYYKVISTHLSEKGYLVFATITPRITKFDEESEFKRIDYKMIDTLSDMIIFKDYQWSTTINPPSPVSSITHVEAFVNYTKEFVSTSKIIIGLETIAYDWELPYSARYSKVTSMTLDRAINLAQVTGATIQFDEVSQTPYFTYSLTSQGTKIEHIVWFVDARTINAFLTIIYENKLQGIEISNLAIFNEQLWLLIYSQYDIRKEL